MRSGKVVIGGESLIDFIPQQVNNSANNPTNDNGDGLLYHPLVGGSPFNCARALGRLFSSSSPADLPAELLGAAPRVFFAGGISNDQLGSLLAQSLSDAGVLLFAGNRVDAPTPLAVVALDDAGVADYSFYRQGTADRILNTALIDKSLEDDLSVFHCGSLSLVDQQDFKHWFHLAQSAKSKGALISIDPNVRPGMTQDVSDYRARLGKVMALADIIKLSIEDLEFLKFATLEEISARHPKALVVLTSGPDEIAVRNGHNNEAIGVMPKLLDIGNGNGDTVGAGDCLQAGLLRFFAFESPSEVNQERLRQTLEFAAMTAGINCTRLGCSPPSYAEVVAQLEKSG